MNGSYEGHTVVLTQSQAIKVGRTEWSDFAIPHDKLMSGQHFLVECNKGECYLSDLASTNGTFVNNERVTKVKLLDGDVIRTGETSFSVTLERDVGTAPESSGIPTPTRQSLSSAALVTLVERPASWLADSLIPEAGGLPYVQGLNDSDPQVRSAAILSAAWTGQRWLREYLRIRATNPDPESWEFLSMFALVAQPSDLERIVALGRTTALGSRRFQLFASYGHPHIVGDLLVALESNDPHAAIAAGRAFARITGADIASNKRAILLPEDGREVDEFEREFLPEETLPDPRRAQEHWNQVRDEFARGVRWRCGLEVSQPFAAGVIDQLDMEGRWEACVRGRYQGTWHGRLSDALGYRPAFGRDGAC